ncbi:MULTISPECIES: penicillin-binding protein activator [Vibrio]|jgi:outer membrane PBP1 activator LpoA protein|uniref:Penicillin-binding protein activator LpoA n=2 Tax=Vibrio harveyi TaxID=669 RepID=A0A8B3DMP3_VIBHA|nr:MULTISPECIES: penicillin-binding protein activator [Vibrio]EKM15523.1 lppC lipofamily protein [Vibrio harveyi]EKO3799184.1 penicillin-binding protein activator [Vibrio harveyi]EKO3810771.1 penicillin-binding protein activator [Vibrio harveyi]EKO3813384.1 penicillin-binding protein activator [Vibrio harveyi]EKO3818682.1 penicillin-binding protein activator [Vibrio harveyi]
MMNHKRLSVPRLLTPVALAITLAACSSGPRQPDSVDITLEPTQSVQNYMIQADSTEGSLQNDWLIMATKAAIQANELDQAELLIKRLSRQQLSEVQQAEWQLARATLQQKQGKYSQLLQGLNFKPWWKLPSEQWKDYYELRADAYQSLNQPFEANRQLVAEGQYASSAEQREISSRIWMNFGSYSENELTALQTEPSEDVLDGWLQLAIYAKTLSSNIPQLKNTLEHWLSENPSHPAAVYTPAEIQNILSLEIVKPNNTALLLPLTGKFAPQAQLIRDGFIFAMMNDQARDPSATLTVIDTHAYSADQIKQRLINENIDFVVGPLQKENVEKLQATLDGSETGVKIPTLALNIPEEVQAGTDMCYLALSPEQEVAQAAKYLFSQGYQFPMILAPNGAYGQRVVEAFNEEWSKYSSNKVATSYFGDKRQLQKNINGVFGLQESQQRIAQMQSLMRISLESQPRSRRDVDAVYIVARSSELTLIKPFIEVAINPDAKPPKLFSNSRSNSGGATYEDLSGVAYSDIPMLINPDPTIATQMNELWPDQSNMEKRLEALGMDAYKLLGELPQMKLLPGYSVDGQTGVLSINNNCVVQRELDWAERGAL